MWRWVLLIACGCGRISFDPLEEPSAFCAQHTDALFCSDFEPPLGLTPWPSGVQHNATYEIADGTLHTASVAIASTDEASAYLVHALPVTGTHVEESFDARIDAVSTSGLVLAQVRLTSATQIHAIEYVYVAAPQMSYVEEFLTPTAGGATQYSSYPISAAPSMPGDWHRYALDLDVTTSPHAILTIDNALVLDTPLAWPDAGEARIEIGHVYLQGPADVWDVRFDNVLADAQ